MRKITNLLLLAVMLISTTTLSANEKKEVTNLDILSLSHLDNSETYAPTKKNGWGDSRFLRRWGFAAGASTLGLRFELATTLNNHFNLRGGFNWIPASQKFMKREFSQTFEIKDEMYKKNISAVDPKFNTTFDLTAKHSHLLIDFTPWKQGILHITAGVFVGNIAGDFNGQLMDPASNKNVFDIIKEQAAEKGYKAEDIIKKYSEHNIEGFKIKISDDASASGKLALGKRIKPYVGIGLGRAIPKYGFTFKLEVGALNKGPFVLESKNIEGDLTKYLELGIDKAVNEIDNKKHQDFAKKLIPITKNWYPMVNLQLVFRFKN